MKNTPETIFRGCEIVIRVMRSIACLFENYITAVPNTPRDCLRADKASVDFV